MFVSRRLHLMPSVFSPGKPAIAKAPPPSRAETKACKRTKYDIRTTPSAEVTAASLELGDMPPEMLSYIIGRTSRYLLKARSVSKAWRAVADETLEKLKRANVCWWSGPRAPLQPTLTEEEQHYVTSCRTSPASIGQLDFDVTMLGHSNFKHVLQEDLQRVLDVGTGGGWLTGVAVDAFAGQLAHRAGRSQMPLSFADDVVDPVPSEGCAVYLPSSALSPARGTADHGVIASAVARSGVIYHVKHISGSHWALMVVYKERQYVHVLDPLGMATKAHALELLTYMSDLSGDTSYINYKILVHGRNVHGLPVQGDAKACGVYACVFMLHLLSCATIHMDHDSIPCWRAYVAAKVHALHIGFAV